MKKQSLPDPRAPTPRMTLWVPGLAALMLSLLWLAGLVVLG